MPATYTDLVLSARETRGAATGSYPTVSGKNLLKHRILLAMASSPGELTHRPDYGSAAELHLGRTASPANRAALSRDVRRAVLAEDGVLDARASAEVVDGRVVVRLEVKLRGQDKPETLAFDLDTLQEV